MFAFSLSGLSRCGSSFQKKLHVIKHSLVCLSLIVSNTFVRVSSMWAASLIQNS